MQYKQKNEVTKPKHKNFKMHKNKHKAPTSVYRKIKQVTKNEKLRA